MVAYAVESQPAKQRTAAQRPCSRRSAQQTNTPQKNLTPNLQTSQIWRIFVSKLTNYATNINHRRN